jgi:hypothetical protein
MAANESAPSTAQSKRERKRQFINERLAFLDEKFRQDRDFTYRDQLQKIQVDTTLIQRLDPYDPNVLDTIADLRREHAEAQVPDTLPESVRSLIQMAGPDFQVFLQEIEDVVENRDANVTQQKVCLLYSVQGRQEKKNFFTDVLRRSMSTIADSPNTATSTISRLRQPSGSTRPWLTPCGTASSTPSPPESTVS